MVAWPPRWPDLCSVEFNLIFRVRCVCCTHSSQQVRVVSVCHCQHFTFSQPNYPCHLLHPVELLRGGWVIFGRVWHKSSNKSGNESGNLRCNWVKTHCSHCRFIVVAKLKDLSCRVTITVQVNLARRHFLTTTFWLPPPPQAPSSLTTCTIPLILPQNGWLLSFFCLPMLSWEIRAIRLGVLLTCRQRRESGQLGVAQSYLYLSLMFSLTSAVSLDVVRLLYHSIRGKEQT